VTGMIVTPLHLSVHFGGRSAAKTCPNGRLEVARTHAPGGISDGDRTGVMPPHRLDLPVLEQAEGIEVPAEENGSLAPRSGLPTSLKSFAA